MHVYELLCSTCDNRHKTGGFRTVSSLAQSVKPRDFGRAVSRLSLSCQATNLSHFSPLGQGESAWRIGCEFPVVLDSISPSQLTILCKNIGKLQQRLEQLLLLEVSQIICASLYHLAEQLLFPRCQGSLLNLHCLDR